MAGIDLNRTSTNVALPVDVSAEIWAGAVQASAVMSLSRRITLPGPGVKIQTITGDAAASWVNETDEKPVSRATLGAKTMTPYKLSVIEPFSDEFRRDLPALYSELARRLPAALAKKLDETVFTGSAPGSGFDVLSGAAAVGIKSGAGALTTYKGLVAADTAISAATPFGGGTINGWALAPQARQYLLGAVDGQNRPLFIDSVGSSGRGMQILGAPTMSIPAVYKSGSPNQVGFAGDWTQAVFGSVEGVQIAVTDTASLADGTSPVSVTGGGGGTVSVPKVLNLWQRNMFAIRAEIEVGFLVGDASYFVRLTDATVT